MSGGHRRTCRPPTSPELVASNVSRKSGIALQRERQVNDPLKCKLQARPVSLRLYQRYRSKADICAATSHVRFTPNSHRESEFPQRAMSALPPKADMCSALAYVRFGPKADTWLTRS